MRVTEPITVEPNSVSLLTENATVLISCPSIMSDRKAKNSTTAAAKSAQASVKSRSLSPKKSTTFPVASVSDVSAETPTAASKDRSFIVSWIDSQNGINKAADAPDLSKEVAKLSFPPELTEWSRITTSGNENDCAIHTVMTALSPTYRKQPVDVKNTLATQFRKEHFAAISTLTPEEKKRVESSVPLETPELAKFSREFKINLLVIAETSGKRQAEILEGAPLTDIPTGQKEVSVLGEAENGPVYPIYNSEQTHYEAVRSPTGEYSLPYDQAIEISKKFHVDVPVPTPNPSPPSTPVSDDFGFIHLTDNVTPPDVIVHKFTLKRDGSALKPSMSLMGDSPATPKIESLRSKSRERKRAEKKPLKRDGKVVPEDSVIVGNPTSMEIPLFHFASDVEKFLDDPKVILATASSILPPQSPLLTPRDVSDTDSLDFPIKESPGITFSQSTAKFNHFYVGPVGDRDHRVALHGLLVTPLTATIQGRGRVELQKGFEMISILTGTLGTEPTGTIVPPESPPPTATSSPPTATSSPPTATSSPPVATSSPPVASSLIRGRSTVPRDNVNTTSPVTVGTLDARGSSPTESVADAIPIMDVAKRTLQKSNDEFKVARDAMNIAQKNLEEAGKEGETSHETLVQLTDKAIETKAAFKGEETARDKAAKLFLDRAEKEYAGSEKITKDAKDKMDKAKTVMKEADQDRKRLEKAYYTARDKANATAANPSASNRAKKAMAVAAAEAHKDFTRAESAQSKAAKEFELYDNLYQTQKTKQDVWDAEIKKHRQMARDPEYVEPTDVAVAPDAVAEQARRSVSPERTGVPAALAEARIREQSPGRVPDFTPGSEGLAERLGTRGTFSRARPGRSLSPGPTVPAFTPGNAALAESLGSRGVLGQPIVDAPAAIPPVQSTIDTGVLASRSQYNPAPAPPECVRVTGTIDDTFREQVRTHIRTFINRVKPGLLSEIIQLESLNDKKLEDYIASVYAQHAGQIYTLQLPSETFTPSSANITKAQTNSNPGGGSWDIPPQCEMGGDIISILADQHTWGNALVRRKIGGANPKGPVFAFKFELDYPKEKTGGRSRSAKRTTVRS